MPQAATPWTAVMARAATNEPAAVFDALGEWAEEEGFHGCAFIKAMVATGDPGSEVYPLAAAHKCSITAYLHGLLT